MSDFIHRGTWEVRSEQWPQLENPWEIRVQIEPPYDPTIALLNVKPKEAKVYARNVCVPSLTTAALCR